MEGDRNMEPTVATALPPDSSQPVLQQIAPSKEETDQLLSALAQPFDPAVIKWVVKATSGKDGKRRGLVAAYADPRAYSDRLNQLLTPSGWTQEYSMHVVQDFQRKNGGKETVPSAKVMVICRVTIFGLNSHSGTGEQWADNDNALTSADAQAFKRACSCFGLGRYLYSLPQVWVELDEFKRPVRFPDLPAWALPEGHRAQKGSQKSNGAGESAQTSGTGLANGNGHGSSQGANTRKDHAGAASSGNGTNERGTILTEIQQLSKSVGRKLLAHVLQTSAGVESVAKVSDLGKLKVILEGLQNVQRGTQRLKAAVGTVGLETLQEECARLQLPDITTDNIPDTNTLRKLIERLEARAKAAQSSAASAASGGSQQDRQVRSDQTKPVSAQLVQVRNEVLARARLVASQSKRSIADVIATASDGSLQYAKMSQLGEADLPKVKAVLQRLTEGKA
jgi:hypothetical protein